MKKLLFLLLSCLAAVSSFAQKKDEFSIELLTPELIMEALLDRDGFSVWVRKEMDEIEAFFKNEKGEGKDVIVLFTIDNKSKPQIAISSRPKLEKSKTDALMKKLEKNREGKTKFSSATFAISYAVNGGSKDKNAKFEPELINPEEKKLKEFSKLDLLGKKKALQDWVKNEVIPVVIHYTANVDASFEGVLNVGKMLKSGQYLNGDLSELTDRNFDYWRACAETAPGMQLIPFAKMCMHTARGEFDLASRYLLPIHYFSEQGALPSFYTEAFSARLQMLSMDLSKLIEKGIELHDKGKYKEAIAQYDAVIKNFPHSAWALHERFLSEATINKDDVDAGIALWKKASVGIYKADPMYFYAGRASNGREAYIVYKRQEIKELFNDKGNAAKDMVKYADIALDLENYAFAAQLYWMIFERMKESDYDNRNILAYYLYCLDRLGEKKMIENFEGDFASEFKKIEAECRERMEANIMYQSMEKK